MGHADFILVQMTFDGQKPDKLVALTKHWKEGVGWDGRWGKGGGGGGRRQPKSPGVHTRLATMNTRQNQNEYFARDLK